MSFKINRVYTRSGDHGHTSLVDGSRVKKTHPRCIIFGGLDEINSHLGLAKESIKEKKSLLLIIQVIEYLQQELFDLGSELATPSGYSYPGMWRVSQENILGLEKLCDHFNENLPELTSFILPGGNLIASHLHVARTVTRRVERDLVSFSERPNEVSEFCLQYVNRLSDLLFVLARYVLAALKDEVPLWIKVDSRKFPI